MSSPVGAFFGGLVAVVLLLLFSWSTIYMATDVLAFCSQTKPCVAASGSLVGEGFTFVTTTVGGLVSALVVAQLSVTEPGKTPSVATFTPSSRGATHAVTAVVVLYLLAWAATGLTALVVGVMLHPRVNPTLADIGSTWLGLAVSAAYAYFGISPSAGPSAAKGRFQVPTRPLPLAADEPAHITPAHAAASSELVLGQKVPNASEVATCGAIVRKIRRSDSEFSTLVSNSNSKIVFKNEEGTGADRMMTVRLKEKLDNLAELVGSEWAGVKLRVTEAWDENNEHSGAALHYEGRAADITTAPADGAKLGRLGRLAVDAGCDWVFFEDSRHVHVSVKK